MGQVIRVTYEPKEFPGPPARWELTYIDYQGRTLIGIGPTKIAAQMDLQNKIRAALGQRPTYEVFEVEV